MRRTVLLTALLAASFALLAACTPPSDPGLPTASGVQVRNVANATIGNSVTSTNVATGRNPLAFWDVVIDPLTGHVIVIGDNETVYYVKSADNGVALGRSRRRPGSSSATRMA